MKTQFLLRKELFVFQLAIFCLKWQTLSSDLDMNEEMPTDEEVEIDSENGVNEEEDPLSGIVLEEKSGYMELSLTVLSIIHCILSLSMLISYYRLKVRKMIVLIHAFYPSVTRKRWWCCALDDTRLGVAFCFRVFQLSFTFGFFNLLLVR